MRWAWVALATSLTGLPARAQVSDGGAPLDAGKFTPTPVLSAPGGTPADRARWLKEQIDGAIADPLLAGARVGVAVAEVDSGKLLYARNEVGLFNPASNVKLFTTAAALAMLGPEYRWKTVVYADGPLASGELKGRLVLKGHGDPTLVVEDLWKLVSDLWAAGVRKVAGDLAVDDKIGRASCRERV